MEVYLEKEDIIKPILISPMDNIQTMLISGIAVGSIFILIAMIFNIINGIKIKIYKNVYLIKMEFQDFYYMD